MNYVSKENMADILTGIARKIGNSSDNSGVVAEQEVLYEGTELITDMTLNTVYQISDITGYDFLILTIEAPIIQSYEDKSVRYIQTEIVKNPMVDGTLKYRYDFVYNSQGFATTEANFGGNYSFPDSTHIRFAPRNYGSDYGGVCLKKVEGIKFVSSSSRENNYSTEEQRIGTWIDGKPLYQKTYECSEVVPYNSWTKSSILAPSNVARLISSQATTEISVMNYISCSFEDGYILLRNDRNDAVTVKSITIQYTKTTDGGGRT